MTSDELRELDAWAAEFVGLETFEFSDDCPLCVRYNNESYKWSPTSTDAPLWQLGMIVDKAYETGVMYEVVDQLFDSLQDTLDYNSTLHLIIKNPAAVIKAIREVVENEKP